MSNSWPAASMQKSTASVRAGFISLKFSSAYTHGDKVTINLNSSRNLESYNPKTF
jgi:hypothetical protein